MDPWFQHYMLSFNPSEKYDIVSWDDDIPNIWKKKSSKPPTSLGWNVTQLIRVLRANLF
jgi:hypothetical protein